jgi:hypothetical protein
MQNLSEIAQLRIQIQLEYEAAQRGLSGPASGIARHDFISQKMERLDGLHTQLVELVGEEEAIAIIAESIWTPATPEAVANQKAEELHP